MARLTSEQCRAGDLWHGAHRLMSAHPGIYVTSVTESREGIAFPRQSVKVCTMNQPTTTVAFRSDESERVRHLLLSAVADGITRVRVNAFWNDQTRADCVGHLDPIDSNHVFLCLIDGEYVTAPIDSVQSFQILY
jgi:hypothetical protein